MYTPPKLSLTPKELSGPAQITTDEMGTVRKHGESARGAFKHIAHSRTWEKKSWQLTVKKVTEDSKDRILPLMRAWMKAESAKE